MNRDQYLPWIMAVLLVTSLAFNWTLLNRVGQIEQELALLSSIAGHVSWNRHQLEQVGTRLADMERQASWIRDLRHEVDLMGITGRGQPAVVRVTWSLRELGHDATVYLVHGPAGDEEPERVVARDLGGAAFAADLEAQGLVPWAFRIVVEEPGRTLTGDVHTVHLERYLSAHIHADTRMVANGDWEIRLYQRPEPKLAWQALESATASYTIDGDTVTVAMEREDEHTPMFRCEVPREVGPVDLEVVYADGHVETGTLITYDAIPEPLFGGK